MGLQARVSPWSWSSVTSLHMACGYTYYGSTHYGWGYLVEHGLRVDLGEVLSPVLDGLGLCGSGVGGRVGVRGGCEGAGGVSMLGGGTHRVSCWRELGEAAGRGGGGGGYGYTGLGW